MKRGINSIDAFLAITLMLFIAFWMQNFFTIQFDSSQEFGVKSGVSAEAIRIGSIMNSFYATSPTLADYLTLTDTLKIFGGTMDVSLDKDPTDLNVTVNVTYNGVDYNSSYPVIKQVNYDKQNQKVKVTG